MLEATNLFFSRAADHLELPGPDLPDDRLYPRQTLM